MIRLVVMAAGQATRMGSDKLALPWKATTVLGYVLTEIMDALAKIGHASELIVVARKPLSTYLSSSLEALFYKYKADWRLLPAPVPLAHTIKTGLEGVDADVSGIGFLPGDQVGVNSATLAGLMNSFMSTEPDALIPYAGLVSGSPVFFHRKLIPFLSALKGEQGGKAVLNTYQGKFEHYAVNSDFFTDLDTPEEYNKLSGNIKLIDGQAWIQ